MLILTHTTSTRDSIRNDLGRPEYSYRFVVEEFRPLLGELGIVIDIDDPERQVDAIHTGCRHHGEPCVFLCFMPPNKTPIGLTCPTIPVAWHFVRY